MLTQNQLKQPSRAGTEARARARLARFMEERANYARTIENVMISREKEISCARDI